MSWFGSVLAISHNFIDEERSTKKLSNYNSNKSFCDHLSNNYIFYASPFKVIAYFLSTFTAYSLNVKLKLNFLPFKFKSK